MWSPKHGSMSGPPDLSPWSYKLYSYNSTKDSLLNTQPYLRDLHQNIWRGQCWDFIGWVPHCPPHSLREVVPWDRVDLVTEELPASPGNTRHFQWTSEIQEAQALQEKNKTLALQRHLLENKRKISYQPAKEVSLIKFTKF